MLYRARTFPLNSGTSGSRAPERASGPVVTVPSANWKGNWLLGPPLIWFGQFVSGVVVPGSYVPQKLEVSFASRYVALAFSSQPSPAAHSRLVSTPLIRAEAAFCTTVTLLGPR